MRATIVCAIYVLFGIGMEMAGSPKQSDWKLEDINIRDPYIFPDEKAGAYYMYRTSTDTLKDGSVRGGVEVFTSKNLKDWKGPEKVMTMPADNWITGVVWAPEVHAYKGKYYLFATLNSDIKWKKTIPGWPDFTFRGTQVFYSGSPKGLFLPFEKKPHTPIDQMALDGTLYVEDGIPYMVYCHEWVQIEDGGMNLVQLKPDLSAPVGTPIRLFNASAASWSTGKKRGESLPTDYVTDGCFLYRSKSGKLLMIWSSFYNNQYAIGIAESTTGKIAGPWRQQDKMLFQCDGGHGMLFKTFDGKLNIIFHGPNEPTGAERALIYEVEDTGETLKLKK